MSNKNDKNDKEIKKLLVDQSEQMAELVSHDKAQDTKIEMLMGFSMTANKYRVVSMCEKIEKFIKNGTPPPITDCIVLSDAFKEYEQMGGNGAIKERVQNILNTIKNFEENTEDRL